MMSPKNDMMKPKNKEKLPLPPDLKAIADKADSILAEEEHLGGEPNIETAGSGPLSKYESTDEGLASEEGEDAAAGEEEEDVTPLMDLLGIDEVKARALWNAAKDMPTLRKLTPKQVARKLKSDTGLRMQVEEAATITGERSGPVGFQGEKFNPDMLGTPRELGASAMGGPGGSPPRRPQRRRHDVGETNGARRHHW